MYCVYEHQQVLESDAPCTVYGVSLVEDASVCVPNLSPDRVAIDRLVQQLNMYHLSPIHLHDYLDDWLIG